MSDELRSALARLVDDGPLPPSGAAAVAAGRRARRRRTLSAVTAAAAAVLAVLAVAFAPGLRPIAGPPATTPTENVDPGRLPEQLPVPGLSPTQIRSLAYQCAMSAASQSNQHPSATQLVSQARIFNYLHDQTGEEFLLYLPSGSIGCSRGPGQPLFGAYYDWGSSLIDWLPGVLALQGPALNLDRSNGIPPNVGIGGRVAADVATVTLDSVAGSKTVPAVNGTVLIRVFAASDTLPDNGAFRVTARDRAGRVLGRVGDSSISCIRVAGHRLYSPMFRVGYSTPCADGVRWEPSRIWNPAGTPSLLPAADTARVTAGCAAAAGVPAEGLHLADTYDAVEIAGSLLTRADGSLVACDYRQLTGPFWAVTRPTPPGRADPITIDYLDSRTLPIYQESTRAVVAGRISAAVSRVQVEFTNGDQTDAELHDGRYYLGASDATTAPDTIVIRAYDKDGHLIGQAGRR